MPQHTTVLLQNLSIGYHVHAKSERIVAHHISAELHSCELTCLLGANGIGKSTLLRTLAMFQPKLEGDIIIDGQSIDCYSQHQLSRMIGIVLTERPEVQQLTVEALISMGRQPYTGFFGKCKADDIKAVNEAINHVGIASLRHRMFNTLSDGERQKVMIAKTLAQQTPIIYLDEPTAFLDFPSKVETMRLLRNISQQQDKTVFLSTHDLTLALQLADQLWLLLPDGLHTGTPRELTENGILDQYLAGTGILLNPADLSLNISTQPSFQRRL